MLAELLETAELVALLKTAELSELAAPDDAVLLVAEDELLLVATLLTTEDAELLALLAPPPPALPPPLPLPPPPPQAATPTNKPQTINARAPNNIAQFIFLSNPYIFLFGQTPSALEQPADAGIFSCQQTASKTSYRICMKCNLLQAN